MENGTKMDTMLSETIHRYCEQRKQQLKSIDDAQLGAGDTTTSDFRCLQIAEKFPILNEWVASLTKATYDLIKTIKDVEQTIVNEDERIANTQHHSEQPPPPPPSPQQASSDESNHGTRKRVKRVRRSETKNKFSTKNLDNNRPLSRNSSNLPLLLSSSEDDGINVATVTDKNLNSIGFCKNLLKKLFTKDKCDDKSMRLDDGQPRTERINNVEFVYVDKSVCCMSTIINDKLTHMTEMPGAETLYADFKTNCTDRIQTLKNVTAALQSSLRHQEELSAQQLHEIHELQKRIKRLKKYRRTNRVLEANVKSICEENTQLLVEAKKIEKKLRSMRKRQPDIEPGLMQ